MAFGLRRSLSLKVICFAKGNPARFITTTIRVNARRARNTLIAIIDCSTSGEHYFEYETRLLIDRGQGQRKDRYCVPVYSVQNVPKRASRSHYLHPPLLILAVWESPSGAKMTSIPGEVWHTSASVVLWTRRSRASITERKSQRGRSWDGKRWHSIVGPSSKIVNP